MNKSLAITSNEVIDNEPEPEVKESIDDFTLEEKLKMSKLFAETNNVDNDRLIENPFVCRSAFNVRMGLGRDPRNNKGNTDYCDLYEIEDGSVHLVNHLDSNMNYAFTKKPINSNSEFSIINKYDYELSAEHLNLNRNDGKELHKDPLPLSFIQINNERDGAVWYKNNYPRIPDDLIPIIARYHWGEPITKKCIKNEKKKIEKKAKQKGLTIEHKKVCVSFD